jgi:hypothetical protein
MEFVASRSKVGVFLRVDLQVNIVQVLETDADQKANS